MIRRAIPAFKAADVKPEALVDSLNAFRDLVEGRLADLEMGRRVAVLDAFVLEVGGTLAVGTAPFPVRVQTPFSVAGAWVVLVDPLGGESQVSTSGVTCWVRPVSGGVDGTGNAMEVQFISGLTINRKYRIRLAVVGVKNG